MLTGGAEYRGSLVSGQQGENIFPDTRIPRTHRRRGGRLTATQTWARAGSR